jgi:O-antigen ligase
LYSELALGSFALHTLIHLNKSQLRSFSLRALLLPASVYLLTVAGTLYTAYRAEAFSEWERQLAILLFPLLFSVTTLDLDKYRLPLLKGMALSCALAIVYLYITAIQVIRYNHLPLRSLFTTAFINHNFSEPIDMHATYFSMYIALSARYDLCASLKPRAPVNGYCSALSCWYCWRAYPVVIARRIHCPAGHR